MFINLGRDKKTDRQQATFDAAQRLQKLYWTANAEEKAALLTRYPDDLSWSELLRLHHLNCVELMNQPQGGTARMNAEFDGTALSPDEPLSALHGELVQRLLALESPFRARYVEVWQGEDQARPADLAGQFRNASASHFGCLEVIRVDARFEPLELVFVPFDDLWVVNLAGASLFRAAKLFYDVDRTDEVVLVPLLYGISWFTQQPYDQDGSMTRFCCHLEVGGEPLGIGIGHQDFQLDVDERRTLLGLGSLSQLVTALEMDDPRFDQKCQKRGIDPDEVRRQYPSQSR